MSDARKTACPICHEAGEYQFFAALSGQPERWHQCICWCQLPYPPSQPVDLNPATVRYDRSHPAHIEIVTPTGGVFFGVSGWCGDVGPTPGERARLALDALRAAGVTVEEVGG